MMEGFILANQFKLLVGSSALAAMLAACGGGGSSSAPASNTSDAATRALPPEIAEIIDEQNELTDALCPDASGDAGEGGSMDPPSPASPDASGHKASVSSFCSSMISAISGGSARVAASEVLEAGAELLPPPPQAASIAARALLPTRSLN